MSKLPCCMYGHRWKDKCYLEPKFDTGTIIFLSMASQYLGPTVYHVAMKSAVSVCLFLTFAKSKNTLSLWQSELGLGLWQSCD